MVPTLIYTAAHGGFDNRRIPLGGAAAISAFLEEEARRQQVDLRLIGPSILKENAPTGEELVHYSEHRYAQFCFDFEKAITQEILGYDPKKVVILSNDISEGPAFRRLAGQGYRIFTIYHVDVVDYVARLYLRGWFRPETLTQIHAHWDESILKPMLPKLLRLVFEKQRDSVLYSQGVIVPSEGMKRTLVQCYPEAPPEHIQVLPWGTHPEVIDEAKVSARTEELRRSYAISPGAAVLLLLSRISPEKGQDRLLQAIALWEKEGNLPTQGLFVIIAGEAAYMQGERFYRRLEKLANALKKVRVIFPGYLAGVEKQAHFRLADLYVFPSRHESYGLTLLEASHAGCPSVVTAQYGSEDYARSNFAELLPDVPERDIPRLLKTALKRLLSDPDRLKKMGEQAQRFAEQQKFSETAKRLFDLVIGAGHPIHE